MDEFLFQLKTLGVHMSDAELEYVKKYIISQCEVNGQIDVGRLIGRTRL